MNWSQLQHDLAADAIAGAARRYRRMRMVQCGAACVVFLGILFWTQEAFYAPTDLSPRLQEAQISAEAEGPVSGRLDEVYLSGVRRIESDTELLAVLEEFGPLIAQLPDGSKRLILTREEF